MARARVEESRQRITVTDDIMFLVFTDAHVIGQHLPVTAREQGVNVGFDEFVRFQSVLVICYQM